MTFTQYANQHAIALLRDDITYLKVMVASISRSSRRGVLRRYVAIWVDARNTCADKLKADNIGRRAANIWIRELIDGHIMHCIDGCDCGIAGGAFAE
jgi:hypothetical protein